MPDKKQLKGGRAYFGSQFEVILSAMEGKALGTAA